MAELLELVGLADQRAFALTGNSTSLVAMSVSAINPRILVFPRVDADLKRPDTMTAVGFVRGEPFVELVSRDPASGDLNFYLLALRAEVQLRQRRLRSGQPPDGGDRARLDRVQRLRSGRPRRRRRSTASPAISRSGHGTKRILRMQELASPWMHWFPQRFVQRTDSDRALVAQFARRAPGRRAIRRHPDRRRSPTRSTRAAARSSKRWCARKVSATQPNPFDAQIATEMKSGASPTWQARFEAHLGGEAIAVPYPRIDVTDEAKRTAAVRSYQDVVRGHRAASRRSLDLREVFSDDAAEKLSFVPQPGADGKAVLLQMCARCHDGRGNPQLSKNHFNVRKLEDDAARGEGPRHRPDQRDGRDAHAALARRHAHARRHPRRHAASCRCRRRCAAGM